MGNNYLIQNKIMLSRFGSAVLLFVVAANAAETKGTE